MVTLSVELTRALLVRPGDRDWVLLASREPVAGLDAPFTLSPYRHELANKLLWLPVVERSLGADAILYPYWPAPPRRHRGAPPAAVFVHDLAFRVFPRGVPWQQRLYMGRLLPLSLPRAGAVLVPSDATRRDLLEAYPSVRPERVHVVAEGAGHLGDAPGTLPPGLAPRGFLLCVATVEPRKNVTRLLEAYALLRGRLPDAPDLVLVGAIPYWADERAVRLLRETPGVRHLGHVDDRTLLALYRGALALAFPSLYEGFGLPLLEAMREGLPALVGNRGALPELAGEAALEVDPDSVEAIAGGLQRLVEDADLRESLGAAGRVRARLYTWERTAGTVLGVLEQLR
jgi:glycosyltransferase involved in cell wall biosynthesis